MFRMDEGNFLILSEKYLKNYFSEDALIKIFEIEEENEAPKFIDSASLKVSYSEYFSKEDVLKAFGFKDEVEALYNQEIPLEEEEIRVELNYLFENFLKENWYVLSNGNVLICH